jgi:predicted amidophosphoribosyltransferase
MTGVWSLGTEMLRNVESFWCPIRFYDDKKCENCKQDFPDVDNGWVCENQGIEQVTALLESKYKDTQESSWFGHPNRKD